MIEELKKLLNLILDFILPKNPEILEIEIMSEKELLDKIPPPFEMINTKYKSLFQYKNKLAKKAIWSIKYDKNEKIISKFSNLLYEFILDNISDAVTFSGFNNPIIIPVPMYKADLRVRGYNQAELITNEIYKIDGGKNFEISTMALVKIKKTKHQSELKNKSDRLKNLKNCFYVNPKIIKNRNIILIDDVITTGTTMNEISKTLIAAGAKKVLYFSIAH